jgi:TonB family protein
MTLLVQPGTSVSVEGRSVEAAIPLRTAAAPLQNDRACVTGRPVERETLQKFATFVIDSVEDIRGDGLGPSDWPRTDIHTSCDKDVTMPTVKTPIRPNYPKGAMQRGLEGVALVEAVLGEDGRVQQVRLLKSLDPKYGLDAEAIKAAKQWTFTPATKDGQPVRMIVTIELTFSLRRKY